MLHRSIRGMALALLASVALACVALTSAHATTAAAPLYGVRIQKTWIPMPDGVRLAVTLYLPDGAPRGARFPALLEYLPYRKDDDEAARDYGTHCYFARHGYVGARVDIRGFGNSEGTPPEREYSAQEQRDGDEIIGWLARQPWSSGKVGMLGISWGGFNSIQMALRRPPALKAILATAATEELFKEDVHYMDGIFHVDEFELTMDLDQGRPGAPDFSLDAAVLDARMNSEPWSLNYMKHQRDGAFWRAPLRPLDQLQVPALLIGGLQDGYRDSIIRMLEQVKAPLKAWIGPWNHGFPNDADYGPLVEWRDQAVRWFDHWLKGIDNGVMQGPRLVIYQQHSHAPGSQSQDIPGEWRAEDWPPRGLAPMTLYLQSEHRLGADVAAAAQDHLRYVPSVGVEAGFWWGELNGDQRAIDAFSLTYDSAPLTTDLAIMGLPQVTLQAVSDAPLADWFVRLADVAPDGTVTLVTGAGINAAQRVSMADPVDLVPDEPYRVALKLHLATWVFPAGHRVRVAVSNALWPMNWPTPYPMTGTVLLGGADGSRIVLPCVPLTGLAPTPFAPPEPTEQPDWRRGNAEGGASWPGQWTTLRDEVHRRSTVIWQGSTSADYPWGRFDHSEKLTYDVDDDHPDLARVQGDSRYDQAVPGHVLTWIGRLDVTSDARTFFYRYTRTLLRDGAVLRTRTWEEPIPRDHQ
jgi:putative CocE/NonD family hydrolase